MEVDTETEADKLEAYSHELGEMVCGCTVEDASRNCPQFAWRSASDM